MCEPACVYVCVFDVRPAFFGALCFHGVCCCFCCFCCCCCCCNVLGRIFACFIVSALSLGPCRPPTRPPYPSPPMPFAMRVPMFLILYIDIWPPACQKREPLPKVDCGSLSEARSVEGVGGRAGGRTGRARARGHAHCH